MTAIQIALCQPAENQIFEPQYLFLYYHFIQPNTEFFRKFRNISYLQNHTNENKNLRIF